MVRYGVRDARTARRLMSAAGGFKVGGRLVVREDHLDALERRLAAAPNPAPIPGGRTRTRGSARADARHPSPASGPDWWRAGLPDDDTAE